MKLPVFQDVCACGKCHKADVETILTGKGALSGLPAELQKRNLYKVFLLADANTWQAAGEKTAELLQNAGISCEKYVFPTSPEPDESAVGAAVMHYDAACQAVVAVGSGVINDIGKILAATAKVPYAIVGTAPSMDGYASATSSMVRSGVKVTLNSKCAEIIVGDTEILKNAPMHMLKSGLGDMVAKYVSICEWRIGHLVTGEYYCETVAQLIRSAVKTCAENAQGLLQRQDAAVEAVFEGLVLGGLAMAYAGVSRPASGAEHYLSHIWDMRALEFGTPMDLHGIQCAVGTMQICRLYEKLHYVNPNKQKALQFTKTFDLEKYYVNLCAFLGSAAEPLIALEKTEGKYDVQKHRQRLDVILENWQNILATVREEIPPMEELEALFHVAQLPKELSDIGLEENLLPMTVKAAKDIRDKYVLPRLLWDLGEEM